MTPQVISLSAAGSTAWIPVDYVQNPYNINIAIVVSDTPNLTCKVEYTLDDIFNPAITPTAFTHATLTGLTSNTTGNITSPVRAIRLTVTAWTSGTATMTALQGVVNPVIYTDQGTVAGPVANQIASIGTPFAILPGDNSANGMFFTNSAGAFTLSAAILGSAWNVLKGCWCYLPANFGGRTYPAGWYWAVFSSDTAGILYTDTYVSGQPSRPSSPTPFPVNLSGWLNQSIVEITGPTGFLLRGGAMGKNGSLKQHLRFLGNITGTKTFRTYVGSTIVFQTSPTTTPNSEQLLSCRNQGVETLQNNSRAAASTGVGASGASVSGFEYTSADTSINNDVSISLQISANTACAILLHADITVTYGA